MRSTRRAGSAVTMADTCVARCTAGSAILTVTDPCLLADERSSVAVSLTNSLTASDDARDTERFSRATCSSARLPGRTPADPLRGRRVISSTAARYACSWSLRGRFGPTPRCYAAASTLSGSSSVTLPGLVAFYATTRPVFDPGRPRCPRLTIIINGSGRRHGGRARSGAAARSGELPAIDSIADLDRVLRQVAVCAFLADEPVLYRTALPYGHFSIGGERKRVVLIGVLSEHCHLSRLTGAVRTHLVSLVNVRTVEFRTLVAQSSFARDLAA